MTILGPVAFSVASLRPRCGPRAHRNKVYFVVWSSLPQLQIEFSRVAEPKPGAKHFCLSLQLHLLWSWSRNRATKNQQALAPTFLKRLTLPKPSKRPYNCSKPGIIRIIIKTPIPLVGSVAECVKASI